MVTPILFQGKLRESNINKYYFSGKFTELSNYTMGVDIHRHVRAVTSNTTYSEKSLIVATAYKLYKYINKRTHNNR